VECTRVGIIDADLARQRVPVIHDSEDCGGPYNEDDDSVGSRVDFIESESETSGIFQLSKANQANQRKFHRNSLMSLNSFYQRLFKANHNPTSIEEGLNVLRRHCKIDARVFRRRSEASFPFTVKHWL
jgi:hypothetical protein